MNCCVSFLFLGLVKIFIAFLNNCLKFYVNFEPKSLSLLDFLLLFNLNSVTFNIEKGELTCKSNSPLRYLII
jgi:hypothetical protein